MTSQTAASAAPLADRLYNLLPAIYRIRDASEGGGALRALLGVIEEQYQALQADISGLYDDWFIETCAEWLVPYIGDLLGVRGLHAGSPESFSLRAYVANTLAYRRRKGTATMLEQLARDVTNWGARTVEYFELLSATQHLNHLRPHSRRTPDLRAANALELLDTPFDTSAHTADVRHIDTTGRRANLRPPPNIPNIGIFLWRLQAYRLDRSAARQINPGSFTFHPLGFDQPLFNNPRTETAITHLAEEINVAAPLRRRPLYAETEGLRQALALGQLLQAGSFQYFKADEPVFQVFPDGAADPIPAEEVLICDLSSWQVPPAAKDYPKADGTLQTLPIAVAVDPVLGRLVFPAGVEPASVGVTSTYGFSGDLGGGPYRRSSSGILKGALTWQVGVSQSTAPVADQVFATLGEAVQAWNDLPPVAGTIGAILIMDSSTYAENLTGAHAINIPAGCQLLIIAADWPAQEDPELPGVLTRSLGVLAPNDVRPHLRGDISVRGTASGTDPNPGTLALNGLLVEGRLTILTGNLGGLQFSHATLAPANGGLVVNPSVVPGQQNNQLAISLQRAICGPLVLAATVPDLSISDSIIDAAGASAALDAPGSDAVIQSSTCLGAANLRSLEASNSIFALLTVERRQAGCVRYSFVADGSQTPRRFRCQPDLELAERATQLGLETPASLPASERTLILNRTKPAFGSIHYGDPDYAQLSLATAAGILTGAEDGSEMGAFKYLMQPQRLANLRASLDEYLRFGLEAGIFFVT
jgi:hypothetical protein